jgi:hypothetical protein
MEKSEEKEKRIKKLLKEGTHVIDSSRRVAICPSTKKETNHGPYDPVGPCKACGRTDVNVQLA